MNFSIEAILNGTLEKPIKTELQVPSFPDANPVIRPTPVYHPYLQPVKRLPSHASFCSQTEMERMALLYGVSNQICGAPPPLPVFRNFQDATLRSARKMESKIERMATTDGAPITGFALNHTIPDWSTLHPPLAFPPFSSQEVQNRGTTSNVTFGIARPNPPVVPGHMSLPVTATPPNIVKHRRAAAHVRNTPLCHDKRLELYSDHQQKLFFDPNSSAELPQPARRDHPTGRWLFENHIRKEAGLRKPKRREFDQKWGELKDEKKQEWHDLASEATAERNHQIILGFIKQNGLEYKNDKKDGRGRARKVRVNHGFL